MRYVAPGLVLFFLFAPPAAFSKNIKTLMMQRTWEPKEQAFSFLLPKNWTTEGGVFNVNPLQMNGPGNTVTPKCDLSVKVEADTHPQAVIETGRPSVGSKEGRPAV